MSPLTIPLGWINSLRPRQIATVVLLCMAPLLGCDEPGSIYAEVSGLVGKGLVLKLTDTTQAGSEVISEVTIEQNGKVFLGETYDTYGVFVVTQPSDPRQICVVSDPTGESPFLEELSVAVTCR